MLVYNYYAEHVEVAANKMVVASTAMKSIADQVKKPTSSALNFVARRIHVPVDCRM